MAIADLSDIDTLELRRRRIGLSLAEACRRAEPRQPYVMTWRKLVAGRLDDDARSSIERVIDRAEQELRASLMPSSVA